MKKTKSSYGFTLIELVVVLSVIAILGTGTLTTARGLQRRTLDNTSRTLQADMRRAQRMALIEGRRWQVRFYECNTRYSILSPPGARPDRIYTVDLPSGVRFDVLGSRAVEYLPRGSLGGAGGVEGGTGFTMVLTSGPFEQEITVLPVSGRVRVFEVERRGGR